MLTTSHPVILRPITWTMLWSLLDLPACTFPLGEIDPVKDGLEPLPGAAFSPYDQEQWSACEVSWLSLLVCSELTLSHFRLA